MPDDICSGSRQCDLPWPRRQGLLLVRSTGDQSSLSGDKGWGGRQYGSAARGKLQAWGVTIKPGYRVNMASLWLSPAGNHPSQHVCSLLESSNLFCSTTSPIDVAKYSLPKPASGEGKTSMVRSKRLAVLLGGLRRGMIADRSDDIVFRGDNDRRPAHSAPNERLENQHPGLLAPLLGDARVSVVFGSRRPVTVRPKPRFAACQHSA